MQFKDYIEGKRFEITHDSYTFIFGEITARTYAKVKTVIDTMENFMADPEKSVKTVSDFCESLLISGDKEKLRELINSMGIKGITQFLKDFLAELGLGAQETQENDKTSEETSSSTSE